MNFKSNRRPYICTVVALISNLIGNTTLMAEEARGSQMLIQYGQSASPLRRVLNVSYGESNNVIELQNVRVTIGEKNFDYFALQIRLPVTGTAEKCTDASLLTQRTQSLSTSPSISGKDVVVIGIGAITPNGPGEAIATLQSVSGCSFQ